MGILRKCCICGERSAGFLSKYRKDFKCYDSDYFCSYHFYKMYDHIAILKSDFKKYNDEYLKLKKER